jgi:hypothetical protein
LDKTAGIGWYRYYLRHFLSFAADDEKEKEEERAEIRQMTQHTLTRLYKAQPAARAAVEKGYGYAVFSNTGVKILLAGSGKGTFMKMLEVQAGLGIGGKEIPGRVCIRESEGVRQLCEFRLGLRRTDLGGCQNQP